MNLATTLPNGFYLALVYLVISGNYLGNLFGCRTQQLFRDSMWMKHLLGLFTTYFLIVLSTPPEGYGATETMTLTAVIYVWFFLTTKMHVKFWVPMILAVLTAYFLHVYKKQTVPVEAPEPTKEEEKALSKKAWIQTAQQVAVGFAGLMTVLGVLAYYGEKRLEYGTDFDAWTFWSGKPDCRGNTPPVPLRKSFLAAIRVKHRNNK